MRAGMSLEFKKVIRGIFEEEICNIENITYISSSVETNDKPSLSACEKGTTEEISPKETECKVGTHDVVLSKKSYKRNSVVRGNLSNNSHHSIVSNNGNNEQVPEWDKVFKSILGNNKAKYDTSLPQKHDVFLSQEHISSPQKHENIVKSRRCPVKNASPSPKNMEEEKVRELFAISRSFKLDDPFQHNLNEYEGLGVNIFKSCDNKASAILPPKSQSLDSVKSTNNSYHCSSKPFEPYTHLTGFIAVKSYLKDNMENSACIPVSEVWDEDFYF